MYMGGDLLEDWGRAVPPKFEVGIWYSLPQRNKYVNGT